MTSVRQGKARQGSIVIVPRVQAKTPWMKIFKGKLKPLRISERGPTTLPCLFQEMVRLWRSCPCLVTAIERLLLSIPTEKKSPFAVIHTRFQLKNCTVGIVQEGEGNVDWPQWVNLCFEKTGGPSYNIKKESFFFSYRRARLVVLQAEPTTQLCINACFVSNKIIFVLETSARRWSVCPFLRDCLQYKMKGFKIDQAASSAMLVLTRRSINNQLDSTVHVTCSFLPAASLCCAVLCCAVLWFTAAVQCSQCRTRTNKSRDEVNSGKSAVGLLWDPPIPHVSRTWRRLVPCCRFGVSSVSWYLFSLSRATALDFQYNFVCFSYSHWIPFKGTCLFFFALVVVTALRLPRVLVL
jgi:hypothetical protein